MKTIEIGYLRAFWVHALFAQYLTRRDEKDFLKKVWNVEVSGKRTRGSPRLKCEDAVMKDMAERMIEVILANDRAHWRAEYPNQGPGDRRRIFDQ